MNQQQNESSSSSRPTAPAQCRTNRLLASVLVLQGLTLLGLWTGIPSAGTAGAAGGGSGIPDPGARQRQMVDELKQLTAKLARLFPVPESGPPQVRVAGQEGRGR